MTPPNAYIPDTANDNKIDELPVGLETSVSWTVNTDDLNTFINLSGDKNPLHVNEQYAVQNGFESTVVHGFLICAKISGLIGMLLPGQRCLLVSEELEFPNPLYLNDHVEICARIKERHYDLKLVKLKILVKKGSITVARGNIICKILF